MVIVEYFKYDLISSFFFVVTFRNRYFEYH